MDDKQIEIFKQELKRYRKYLMLSSKLQERLDLLLYDLSGVKGISFDNVKGTANATEKELKRLHKIDEYNDMLMTKKYIDQHIHNIQKTLNKMRIEDKEMFVNKYLDGMSFYSIGKIYYMSKSGVINYMNNVLRKVEDNDNDELN